MNDIKFYPIFHIIFTANLYHYFKIVLLIQLADGSVLSGYHGTIIISNPKNTVGVANLKQSLKYSP